MNGYSPPPVNRVKKPKPTPVAPQNSRNNELYKLFIEKYKQFIKSEHFNRTLLDLEKTK